MLFDEPSPEEFKFRLPTASYDRVDEERITLDGWVFHYQNTNRHILSWLKESVKRWRTVENTSWPDEWMRDILETFSEAPAHWHG